MLTIKQRDEDYEHKLNTALPRDFHRGDLHSTTRLQGYCDAMYATCATFLVLPLRNLKEMEEEQTLPEFVHERAGEYVIFFIGFFVICTMWEMNVKRFSVVKRLDDFLVFLVILSLLATTMLPFSLSLKGHFEREEEGGLITSGLIASIELIEIIIVVIAFNSPRLLHIDLHQSGKAELRYLRNLFLMTSVFNIILCFFAGAGSFLHYSVTWVLISLVILIPLMRKFNFYVRRRRYFRQNSSNRKKSATNRRHLYWELSKGNISKERVEAMSDASVAIIACVLVLDITVEEFPHEVTVHHHGLHQALHHMGHNIAIFIGAYGMVSAMWYVNHTVLHMFHTIDVVLLYLQKAFLAFASLSPFCSQVISKFSGRLDEEGSVATRIGFLFPLCAYVANMCMLFWGYYKKEKLMHRWAVHGNCLEANRPAQLYILLKTTLTPLWILVGLIASFGPGHVLQYIRYIVYGLLALTFIVLKLMFMCHLGKKTYVSKRNASYFSDKEDGQENGGESEKEKGGIPILEVNGMPLDASINMDGNPTTKSNVENIDVNDAFKEKRESVDIENGILFDFPELDVSSEYLVQLYCSPETLL